MVESLPTKNETVSREIEGEVVQNNYIEEIEKQAENSGTDITVQSSNQSLATTTYDPVPPVMPANAVILPATQTNFNQGSDADVKTSAKWLTTWCLFMIKKYGSRVFFKGE